MSDLKATALEVGASVAHALIGKLGNEVAEGLLNGIVDLIGSSVATSHINQYAAARIAADALEAAKFGNEP